MHMPIRPVRIGLLLAATVAAVPLLLAGLAEPAPPAPKTEELTGKVVPLAGPLEKFGAKLDADAAPAWLALVTEDGKTYPLIKDSGSRMFFKDAKLQDRPVRLTGRMFGDTRLLQVLSVRTLVKGVLHEPYYWCDVCKIKRLEPNACDCCGAPLEFREESVEK
jgi:hypothetical protein